MSDPHETHSGRRQRPLSAEHKAKMVAGRAAARQRKIEAARRLLGIEAPKAPRGFQETPQGTFAVVSPQMAKDIGVQEPEVPRPMLSITGLNPYGKAPGMRAALAAQLEENAGKLGRLREAAVAGAAAGRKEELEKLQESANVLAGLTARDCCDACSEKGCAISGDVCVHPYKGGLHSAHQMNPDVRRRFNEAKNMLAQAALDKKL